MEVYNYNKVPLTKDEEKTGPLYAKRDVEMQGDYYFDHVSAMTGEGLHSKSDIAAELAHRDIEIDRLKQQIKVLETKLHWEKL